MTYQLLLGDCLDTLQTLPAESVQTCITSPPYFGLRDYGHDGQIGLEPSVDEYVAKLVAVFRAVRRVLKDDGTVWLNLGDSYAGGGGGNYGSGLNVSAHQTNPSHLSSARRFASGRMRLRADLAPDQVAYVLGELARHSQMASATVEGDE